MDETKRAAIENLIGKRLKCTLDDDRIVLGTFHCLDRLKNMILCDVVEERWINASDYSTTSNERIHVQRRLAQAMVPGKFLTKVEVVKETYELLQAIN